MMNTGQLKLRRNNATTTFLAIVGVLLAYLCFQIAQPFLEAIAWAGILAIVFAPMHTRIGRVIKNTDLAALASTLPPKELSVETSGRVEPVGQAVRKLRGAVGTTVTFIE